jgi:hypothetical protein
VSLGAEGRPLLCSRDQGQFGNPEEAESPPSKAATKQRLVKAEKTLRYVVIALIFGVYNSLRLS